MRRVNYKVINAYGGTFNTTDYAKATAPGNRIESTFLTPVDLVSDKVKASYKIRIAKMKEKAKRG